MSEKSLIEMHSTMSNGRSSVWDTADGHSPLSVFFNLIYPISAEAVDLIDKGSFPVAVKKGGFLIKPNQEDKCLYLLMKGVIRAFIKEEGKEITTWINEENEIVGSARSLGLADLPIEYLQALEDCSLIGIPYDLIEHLYHHHMETNIVGRLLLEDNYRGAEERAYICRIPSAGKRYRRFVDTHPGLINRISLKYIASYLSMTNETLSRIRRKMMKNK